MLKGLCMSIFPSILKLVCGIQLATAAGGGSCVGWKRPRGLPFAELSLRNGEFCFSRMPDSFVFANVNICKSRCWVGADWGPPGGLEEALFTCSEECCPAPTLLYLSGTQGHRAGRDGPLCPSPKFPPRSINNKTQCGRAEKRNWNSCSCRCKKTQLQYPPPPSPSFLPLIW